MDKIIKKILDRAIEKTVDCVIKASDFLNKFKKNKKPKDKDQDPDQCNCGFCFPFD